MRDNTSVFKDTIKLCTNSSVMSNLYNEEKYKLSDFAINYAHCRCDQFIKPYSLDWYITDQIIWYINAIFLLPLHTLVNKCMQSTNVLDNCHQSNF